MNLMMLLGHSAPAPRSAPARAVRLLGADEGEDDAAVEGDAKPSRKTLSQSAAKARAAKTKARRDRIATFITANGPSLFEEILAAFRPLSKNTLYRDMAALGDEGRVQVSFGTGIKCWAHPDLDLTPGSRGARHDLAGEIRTLLADGQWRSSRWLAARLIHKGVHFSNIIRSMRRLIEKGEVETLKGGPRSPAHWRLL